MTSTSIYTPIIPTYLYIKQHSITKKKYFGKTTKTNPYTYNGSGDYWGDHIKVHGKEHIVTLWVSDLYYDTSIVEVALKFSVDNDIVKSKEWANLKPENGLDGCLPGVKRSEESKAKQSANTKGKPKKPMSEEGKANMRKPKSEEHKANMRKPKSEEHKANMRKSEETKAKMSATQKGIPKPQVTCPHCGKTGGENVMKRWHFNNCNHGRLLT
jgi:hypothetical protein